MNDLKNALLRIEDYAKERNMTPEQVEACFLAGWYACVALRKDWAAQEPSDD